MLVFILKNQAKEKKASKGFKSKNPGIQVPGFFDLKRNYLQVFRDRKACSYCVSILIRTKINAEG